MDPTDDAAPEPARGDTWRRVRRWAKHNAAGPASSVLSKVGLMVSRDDVLWCYRHLLGREPESEEAVLSHLRFRDFRALVRHFVDSPEYSGQRGAAPAAGRGRADAGPGIGAEAFRAAIADYRSGRPPSQDLDVYVETHFERLLHTLNVVGQLLPRGGAMIDFSAAKFFAHALDRLHPGIAQSSVTGVNFERDPYVARFGPEQYDLCLNTEVLEHLLFDPAHMVYSINRMLKPGGRLYLTTPNALSMANALRLMQGNAPTLWNQVKPNEPYYERHNREWTPFEVVKLLEEHGFEILEVYTEDFYGATRQLVARRPQEREFIRSRSSHDYFGDTLCVIARRRERAGAPVRNPWLYAYHEHHVPAERRQTASNAVDATTQAGAATGASSKAMASVAAKAARPAAKVAGTRPGPAPKAGA